jgi:hypothetical protein
MKAITICIGIFYALTGWAQSLPPTNIFTATGNPLPPPAIPPLTQVYVPQSNGDHSTDPDLFRRQFGSIVKDVSDKGGSMAELEARLSTLMGTKAIKPQAGTLGAQFYPFAFQIVPTVTGKLSNGQNATWNWIRFKYNTDSNKLMGGHFVMKGDGSNIPPGTLFMPPPGAVPPRPAASTPQQPVPGPLPPVQPVAPAPPIKVSVHTWTRISTGGSARTIVMRMVGNFRGIVKPAPARKSSRTVKVNASSQSQARSASTASRGFFFRGHGTFSMHIRTLPSKSFQRRSLRAGQ